MNAKTKGSPFKWLGAMVMSLLMVLACLPTVALAQDVNLTTVTVWDGEYEAYQIFSGTWSTDNDGNDVLSNIDWGTDITADGKKALATAVGAAEDADAKTVAEALSSVTSDSTKAIEIAQLLDAYTTGTPVTVTSGNPQTMASGYYLLKDVTNGGHGTDGDNTVVNLSVLQVVGDKVNVTKKVDVPSLTKKIKDINDSTDTTSSDWQKTADYDIGDTIPYQLTAQLPRTNWNKFKTYYLQFNDDPDTGLAFKSVTSVKIMNGATVVATLNPTGYVVTGGASDGDAWALTIYDVKAFQTEDYPSFEGYQVVVEYEMTLETTANIGSEGNFNTAYLKYSNNPNWTGAPSEEEQPPTGETPEDQCVVFTYKSEVTKQYMNGNDAAATPTDTAKFKLYKWTGDKTNVPTTAPTKEAIEAENSGWTIVGTEQSADKNNQYGWKGIDDGTYVIVESYTPNGFNTADPVLFTVSATHGTNGLDLTSLMLDGEEVAKKEGNTFSGVIAETIANYTGSTLPSTGGMGTTLLYAVGGALVVVAAGILIYKKVRPQEG